MNENPVLNVDDYDMDAIQRDLPKLLFNEQYFNRLAPVFSDPQNVNLGLQDETEIDLQTKKEIALASVYAGKFKIPPTEAIDNLGALSGAFHGEDNLSIDDQFNRIKEVYDITAPKLQSSTQASPSSSGIFNIPVNHAESPEEQQARQQKLNQILGGTKPLNEMISFGYGEKVKDIFKAWGRGSVGILSGLSGAMRLLPETNYMAGPGDIVGEPIEYKPAEVANFLDDYIKEGMEFYKQNGAITSEWQLKGAGKYKDPFWWTNNITEMMPFIASTGAVGGVTGSAMLKLLGNSGKLAKWGAMANSTVAMSATEALTEAGNAAQQVKELGGSDDAAGIAAWSSFGKNSVMLNSSNFLQMALARMPGKLGKILALAFDAPIESAQELIQDRFAKEAIIKALPAMIAKVNPDKSWVETFNVIDDPEKRDTAILGGILGVKDWGTSLYLATKENVIKGQQPPVELARAEQIAFKQLKEQYHKEVTTPFEQAKHDLIGQYITPDGTFRNTDELITKYHELTTAQNKETAAEILNTELAPEEMQRPELIESLGLKETTLSDDELRLKVTEKEVEKIAGQKTAFEDLLGYYKNNTQNEVAIKLIDTLKRNNDEIIKGEYVFSPDEKAKAAINLYYGADPLTVAHEIAHAYSDKVLKYNEESGEFAEAKLNNDLDNVAKLYQDRGIFAPSDRNELFSKLAEDYLEGNLNESFLSRISEGLRKILEKIKAYFTDISGSAKAFKELVASGDVSPELLGHIENAVQGKVTKEQVSEMVNNSPQVQAARNEIDQVADEIGLISEPIIRYQKENIPEKARNEQELIEQFNKAVEGLPLKGQKKEIYDLINKKRKYILFKRGDNSIKLEYGKHDFYTEKGKGIIHILARHFNSEDGILLPEEILNIGEVIQFGDETPYTNIEGKKSIRYILLTKGNINLIAAVNLEKTDLISFFSNRKKQSVDSLPIISGAPIFQGINQHSNNKIPQSSEKSNSSSTITRQQTESVGEFADNLVKTYEKIRRAETILETFKLDEDLEKTFNIKNEILGRLEELTGKTAPIGQDKATQDNFIRKDVKSKVRYMKSDKHANEKFLESLKNSSPKDLEYMKKGLESIQRELRPIIEKASQTKDKTTVDVILSKVNDIQREMESYIKALPTEIQAFALSRIRTAGQKAGKSLAAQDAYITDSLKAIDEIRDRNKAYSQVQEMSEALKNFLNQKDYKGRKISRNLIAKVVRELNAIKEVMWMKSEESENLKFILGEQILHYENILGNNGAINAKEKDKYDSLLDDYYRVCTFGNILGKSHAEVNTAYNEMMKYVEEAKYTRDILNEERKQKYEELRNKTIESIYGDKKRASNVELDAKREKRKNFLINAIDRTKNFLVNHNLDFTLSMNLISLYNKKEANMKSFLDSFAQKVQEATDNKDTGIRKRSKATADKMCEVFGVKKFSQLMRNKVFRGIYEKKDTDIIIHAKPLDEDIEVLTLDYTNAKTMADTYMNMKTNDMIEYKGFLVDAIGIRHLLTDVFQAERNIGKNLPHQEEFKVEVLKKRRAKENLGKLSYGEALYYWLWVQQPNGVEQAFYNGWTTESMEKLDKFLPEEIKEMGRYFMEQGSTVNYDKMNKVFKQQFFVDMDKVDNYFRMFFEGSEEIDPVVQANGGYVSPTANIGSLISRVAHKKNLKRQNAFDVWNEAILEQEHYINFALLASELRAVFKSEEVNNSIEDLFGQRVKKMIGSSVDNVIRGGIDPKLINKVVTTLRNGLTTITYFGKLIMLPKLAITGSVQYPGEVPMGQYAKYLIKFWMDPKNNFKSAFKSDYVQNRLEGSSMMIEMSALKAFAKGNPFRTSKAIKIGMAPTRYGDAYAATIGYWIIRRIKFDEFRKQGMGAREAAKEAKIETSRIIDRVQGSSKVKDWGYHQSQGSWNSILQLYQTNNRLFSTYTINDIRAALHGKKNATAPALRKMAFYWVIGSLLYQFLDDMIREGFDPEHEIEPEDYAIAVLTMPAAGLFLATNVVNAGIRRAFGKRADSLNLVPGLDPIIQGIGKSIEEFADGDAVEGFNQAMRPIGAYNTAKWMTASLREE